MKEYKVIETRRHNVEKLMNDMAKQGWEVVSTALWRKLISHVLLITFSLPFLLEERPETFFCPFVTITSSAIVSQ